MTIHPSALLVPGYTGTDAANYMGAPEDFEGFGGSSNVIWVRERGKVTVNGDYFHDNHANQILNPDGYDAEVVINGGTFESAKNVLYVYNGNGYVNGGFCPYHRRGQRGDQSRRRLTMGTLQGRNVS